MKRVYHLSHIDLDGYGCQYLSTECFDDIVCYNANYGPEVSARLEEITSAIEISPREGREETLILVTDLNLSAKECSWLEKRAVELGVKVQLLDHHGTGEKMSERYAWYYLDTTRSATKITYEWLRRNYDFDPDGNHEILVDAINAIDIWLSESEYFEYGKVMLGMISGAREINRILFPSHDREYKLTLIGKAEEILRDYPLEEAPIVLDDMLHAGKKSFFMKERNDTKDNLVSSFVTSLLSGERDRMTISYGEYRGILGYNVGNASLIGNAFLVANPEYDFYMDVNSRGNFSLRSNDKVDVSRIAEKIGNGGGHPNASGGKIENFKDSFVYERLRDFIQEYMDRKREE